MSGFKLDTSGVEDRIVELLDRWQARDVKSDEGCGCRSARDVGNAVGVSRLEARDLLESLAAAGRVRRHEASNGLFWSSTNPLPWEPGGSLWLSRQPSTAPRTLLVQAYWTERGHTMSRDVEVYHADQLDRAEARVRLENHNSEARDRDDRAYDAHLRDGYRPRPRYRIVSLAIARATGEQG